MQTAMRRRSNLQPSEEGDTSLMHTAMRRRSNLQPSEEGNPLYQQRAKRRSRRQNKKAQNKQATVGPEKGHQVQQGNACRKQRSPHQQPQPCGKRHRQKRKPNTSMEDKPQSKRSKMSAPVANHAAKTMTKMTTHASPGRHGPCLSTTRHMCVQTTNSLRHMQQTAHVCSTGAATCA